MHSSALSLPQRTPTLFRTRLRLSEYRIYLDDRKNSRDLDSHLLALSGARLIGHGSLLLAELESSHDVIERRKKILNAKEHRLSVCVLNPFYIFPNSR